jgi:hypothetical protein
LLTKSGRENDRPLPDKDGWWDFWGEARPPLGEVVEVKGSQDLGGWWKPYLSLAVLTPAGWVAQPSGIELDPREYRLTHWKQ